MKRANRAIPQVPLVGVFESSVLVAVHNTSAIVSWTSVTGVITQADILEGKLTCYRQIRPNGKILKIGVSGWTQFFPQQIDVNCVTFDPDGAIRFYQGIKAGLEETQPKPPRAFVIAEAAVEASKASK